MTRYKDDCLNVKDALIDLFLKQTHIKTAMAMSDYDEAIKTFDSIIFPDMRDGDCLNVCSYDNYSPTGTSTAFSGGCITCGN